MLLGAEISVNILRVPLCGQTLALSITPLIMSKYFTRSKLWSENDPPSATVDSTDRRYPTRAASNIDTCSQRGPTWLDVLPHDADVTVPVGAALLVVEAEGVEHLVLDGAVVQAALAVQRHSLGVTPATHVRVTAASRQQSRHQTIRHFRHGCVMFSVCVCVCVVLSGRHQQKDTVTHDICFDL